jgi:hypothetical protein
VFSKAAHAVLVNSFKLLRGWQAHCHPALLLVPPHQYLIAPHAASDWLGCISRPLQPGRSGRGRGAHAARRCLLLLKLTMQTPSEGAAGRCCTGRPGLPAEQPVTT